MKLTTTKEMFKFTDNPFSNENGFVRLGKNGSDLPQQRLHIMGGSILLTHGEADLLSGSYHGSIYFGPNKKFGVWGIEYNDIQCNGGLNFWKPYSSTEPTQNFLLFLSNNGNVGIGTNNPLQKFQVEGNTLINGIMEVKDISVINRIGINTSNPEAFLHVEKGNTILNGDLKVGNENYPVNNLSFGKMGINTLNPLANLHVDGNVSIGFLNEIPVNGNNLLVNGLVGIGTVSPSEKLEVVGKIKTNAIQITENFVKDYILSSDEQGNAVWINPQSINSGPWQSTDQYVSLIGKNVGIGVSTPTEKLTVYGNISCKGNIKGGSDNVESFKIFSNSDESNGAYISLMNSVNNNIGSIKMYSRGTGNIEFHNNSRKIMQIDEDNNVYIGTPGNVSNLYVLGQAEVYSLKVHYFEWWDKVFAQDYNLRSLTELENYIKINGHLPEVPTEEEIITDGADIAQMNSLLIKKIEELTLYILALEKRISNLENSNLQR